MFQISCCCKDKDLGNVLRTLASAGAYNVVPVPLTDAAVDGDKVKSTRIAGLGKGASAVANQLNGHTEITTDEIKKMLTGAGVALSSYGHVRSELVKIKLLKPKSRGLFEVRK